MVAYGCLGTASLAYSLIWKFDRPLEDFAAKRGGPKPNSCYKPVCLLRDMDIYLDSFSEYLTYTCVAFVTNPADRSPVRMRSHAWDTKGRIGNKCSGSKQLPGVPRFSQVSLKEGCVAGSESGIKVGISEENDWTIETSYSIVSYRPRRPRNQQAVDARQGIPPHPLTRPHG